MNIPIESTDDFFTNFGNALRIVYNCKLAAWALVIGLLASLIINWIAISRYDNALRNCGFRLATVEKAYNVNE